MRRLRGGDGHGSGDGMIHTTKTVFPVGARVYIDGRDLAIVRAAFPEGSSSYLFPHYKVDVLAGDKNMAVAMSRIGVKKRSS